MVFIWDKTLYFVVGTVCLAHQKKLFLLYYNLARLLLDLADTAGSGSQVLVQIIMILS
jgi:hypothetical protein